MMADVLPSVTETQIFTALRSVILSVVGCEVIRAQKNRVAMPVGDFVAMSPLLSMPTSVPVKGFTATTETLLAPTRFTVQIDCYGALSCDRAKSISTILRSNYAVEQFIALGYDMQTLYASDANQMPLETGEEQYLERWTFEAVMQINPVLTLAIQTANTLTVGIVNVEATYPA